jgi:hypothetical protein
MLAMESVMRNRVSTTTLLALTFLAAFGEAAWAQYYQPGPGYAPAYPPTYPYEAYPYGPYPYAGLPLQVQDQLRHHHSGTAGRMGLGADAAHPEGPGNVTVPSIR